MAKLTASQLEGVLVSANGNYSQAAALARKMYGVNISRQAVHERVAHSERLKSACIDARESIVDLAENKLLEKILSGDTRAILFTLETMGKNRGWSKRLEVEARQQSLMSPASVLAEIEQREKKDIPPTITVQFVDPAGEPMEIESRNL